MSHVVIERLVGQALGEPEVLSVADLDHLKACPDCQQIAEELRAVVLFSSDRTSPSYAGPPDPEVWLAIKARLGAVEQLPARPRRSVTRPAAQRLVPWARRVVAQRPG